MPHSSRGWTGARTPSAIKRVRQTQRRRLVNQPRRTAAKTLVAKAIVVANDAATNGTDAAEVQQAVERAISALDRAAKIGAIHRNAADRRKSRLMLKINATLAGEAATATTKQARQTSKAAATKQAKARIAASRATKAKGAQTAAGKARAALARTTRGASADKGESATTAEETTVKTAAKASTTKTSATKTTAAKSSARSTTAKATASKSTTAKAAAKTSSRSAAKKS